MGDYVSVSEWFSGRGRDFLWPAEYSRLNNSGRLAPSTRTRARWCADAAGFSGRDRARGSGTWPGPIGGAGLERVTWPRPCAGPAGGVGLRVVVAGFSGERERVLWGGRGQFDAPRFYSIESDVRKDSRVDYT